MNNSTQLMDGLTVEEARDYLLLQGVKKEKMPTTQDSLYATYIILKRREAIQ